jgi:hypothetical protein
MHWTAGFRLCWVVNIAGPPPVMSLVKPRRMKGILLFLLALPHSGCVEPYPGWTVRQVPFDELPGGARKSFSQQHSNERILAVEQSTFESRLSGYPKLYRITFLSAGGGTNSVIYDKKGRPSDLQMWFDQPPQQGGVGGARP